mgnify:CR=1 FL=1
MKRFEFLIEWALFLCALLSVGTTVGMVSAVLCTALLRTEGVIFAGALGGAEGELPQPLPLDTGAGSSSFGRLSHFSQPGKFSEASAGTSGAGAGAALPLSWATTS